MSNKNPLEELARVIDETAFSVENFYEDNQPTINHIGYYWHDRRMRAFLLAEKIYHAGYRFVGEK